MGGDGLTGLASITLGLCVLGLAGSVWVAARQGSATAGLGLLFACGALRQTTLLYEGSLPAFSIGPEALGELAIMGAALGALLALRSLRRTTRERDRVEDLHWDSMEAVRVMSELAARPGAKLADKLHTMLELGSARFGLELGVAWREGENGGEVIAFRAPGAAAEPVDPRVSAMLPRLRDVCRGTRPALLRADAEPRVLFGAPISVGGEVHGALAFAGSRAKDARVTATDKDLLRLMAQWLASELERRERRDAPPVQAPPPPPRPARPAPESSLQPLHLRRGRDLNTAVRRAERGLRRWVGADALLELDLDPRLPSARSGRLSLSTLVESLVLAVARIAPTGSIRIETRTVGDVGSHPDANADDLILCASVEGGEVDANVFQELFREPQPIAGTPREILSLAQLEPLLRRDGGDLSGAVEPGKRAALTAYLPPAAAPARAAGAPGPVRTQPSR